MEKRSELSIEARTILYTVGQCTPNAAYSMGNESNIADTDVAYRIACNASWSLFIEIVTVSMPMPFNVRGNS